MAGPAAAARAAAPFGQGAEDQTASLAAFRQSQWQLAADASGQHQALPLPSEPAAQHTARPSHQLDAAAAPLELQDVPAAVEVTSISSSGKARTSDSLASSTDGSEDLVNDAGAIMRDALLQRFKRRRAGKVMQKALSGWWRYTVARKAMAAVSARQSEKASESHSVISIAAEGMPADGQPEQHNQQQQLQSVSLALKGLKDGLQQYLAAGPPLDDVQFVLSGEVRLQHSPVKHRPAAANGLEGRGAANRRPPAKDNGAADAAAAAFAAYAKPLQQALADVHTMVEAMEQMCVASAGSRGSKHRQHKNGSPGSSRHAWQSLAAVPGASSHANGRGSANSMRGGQQQPQPQLHPAGLLEQVRSPDKNQLRGQLKNVQDRLVKIEVKMCQAQSFSDDQCCSGAPNSSSSPPMHPSPARGHRTSKNQRCVNGCGSLCKGGCVQRAGARRRLLVGRMQDEIGQLQHELVELRELLPGAFA